MRASLPFLSVLFIFSAAHNVSAEENAPSANSDIGASPTKEQVASWIEQLGDEEYEVREAAERILRNAGSSVTPMLESAHRTTGDAETCARLDRLLCSYRWMQRFDEARADLRSTDFQIVRSGLQKLLDLAVEEPDLWIRARSGIWKSSDDTLDVQIIGDHDTSCIVRRIQGLQSIRLNYAIVKMLVDAGLREPPIAMQDRIEAYDLELHHQIARLETISWILFHARYGIRSEQDQQERRRRKPPPAKP
ncbi:MAG: hypothetical protein L6R28_20860 [Planctomycetes bacterium]|nr:hypothetical protein [Planctomycetota bacterium]